MNSWVAGVGRSPAGPECTSLGRSLPCVGLAVLSDLLRRERKEGLMSYASSMYNTVQYQVQKGNGEALK